MGKRRGARSPLPLQVLPAWRDDVGPQITLPEPPPSVAALPEAADRERASEVWIAGRRVLAVLDCWRDWRAQLRATGDADPGLAWRYHDAAAGALRALHALGVNVPLLADGPGQAIDLLPPPPSNDLGGERWTKDASGAWVARQVPSWQADPEYRAALWDHCREARLAGLEGELCGLLEMLKTYPTAALANAAARAGDGSAGQADAGETVCEVDGGLPSDSLGREWSDLRPVDRRVLAAMRGRDETPLDEVCPLAWGKSWSDTPPNGVRSSVYRISRAFALRGWPRSLVFDRKGERLVWR